MTARGIEARRAETAQRVPCAAREPGGEATRPDHLARLLNAEDEQRDLYEPAPWLIEHSGIVAVIGGAICIAALGIGGWLR